MNQKFKTIILWALPILLVIALSYQFYPLAMLIHLSQMELPLPLGICGSKLVTVGSWIILIQEGYIS